jgi:hypothetical protein
MMKQFRYLILFFAVLFSACSLNDLDPSLANEKDVAANINNLEDLQGLANGMYDRMTVTGYYGRNMQIYGEVRSDNCFANGTSGRFIPEAQMTVSPDVVNVPWEAMYAVIASSNIIVNADLESLLGDKQEINQIVGQAHIARALAYFDLLRLFGQQHAGGNLGVPVVFQYRSEDRIPARKSVETCKNAIFDDIDAGLKIMSEAANPKSKQQISTFTAYALKARVALYFKEWEKAKSASQFIINSEKFGIVDAAGFVNSWKTKNGNNSVFELAASASDNLGINGLQFIYRGSSYGDIEVLDDLLKIFDENDVRKSSQMIGNENIAGKNRLRNFGKYPSSDFSDNIQLFRFEEQVLILAESKIELGENDALEVLNLIPAKRGAELYTEATKENVLLERRKELCFEGFRFDDLARTGSDIPLVDKFRQTHDGPKYGSYKYAFPIPTVELNVNSNMVQNEGYK